MLGPSLAFWSSVERAGRHYPRCVPARSNNGSTSVDQIVWSRTVMELSKTTFLLVHAYRIVAFTFAVGMPLTAPLPSHPAKELIRHAGYNELQQREKRTLWPYV